jgi:hypothetical protein
MPSGVVRVDEQEAGAAASEVAPAADPLRMVGAGLVLGKDALAHRWRRGPGLPLEPAMPEHALPSGEGQEPRVCAESPPRQWRGRSRRRQRSIASFVSATAMLCAVPRAVDSAGTAGLGAGPCGVAPLGERALAPVNALPCAVRIRAPVSDRAVLRPSWRGDSPLRGGGGLQPGLGGALLAHAVATDLHGEFLRRACGARAGSRRLRRPLSWAKTLQVPLDGARAE